MTDLNVKLKTIKLLEDNIEEDLHYLGFSKEFLDMTPKAKSIKEKIIHWNLSKLKALLLSE